MPVILLLMLGYLVWQGFYTVDAHQQAVLMRFGRYHSTQGPGLHFKIPLGEKAILVDVAEHSKRLPFGVREQQGAAVNRRRQDESLILTGDLYAGVVEWNVIWRVVEPKDFLFSINDQQVDNVITGVARSVMHRIVGDYSADEILTSKREEIGVMALKEMQNVMQSYESGIAIIDLQMQRVVPPDRVRAAFDEVNASIQERDQKVNEAKQERAALIPKAEADRDKLIREAEGYAARRRAEASGEISALLAKYQEYKLAPDVTRQRLYLETMERVMENSGPKTIMDGDLKGLLPILNLDSTNNSTTGK
jgi:membrane protease subunit HflK